MTIISKASAYPKSVQSGLPRLGACSPGWTRGPLSAHLIEELRPLNMADDEVYDLVTVKRSRGGVVLRERLKGSQIAVKSQFRLKAGDFLISKRQIVHGACGIVPPELDGAIVSNEYSILRARPSLDLDFLNCLAHSIYFQQTCFHSSIGVHVEKMIFKLDEWMKWDFDLPPIAEQRRLVEVLSSWDAAIRTTELRIKNARTQSAGLSRDLLSGRRRLTGFDSQWTKATLAEVCRTYSGGTPSRSNANNFLGHIPWIKSGELNDPEIFVTDECISQEALDASATKIVPSGTLLLALYGATAGVISVTRIDAAINQAILAIIPDRTVSQRYLKHELARVMGQVKSLTQGAQPNLNAGIINDIVLSLPSLPEQEAIADVLDVADGVTTTLCRAAETLRRERAGLMQVLLRGGRRVPVAGSEAA